MKRILGMIFLLFFGICGTFGGAALFSGCSQSQVENGGGGTSSPSEDETTENPNKNDETEGQGCNYDFTVKNYVYTSTSGYAATASSTSSSTGAKASFSIYWFDNGKAVDWGNIPTTAGGYYAISNGSSNWSSGKVSSSSQTYAGPLSYFDYTFTDGNWFWYPDRYARIIPGYYKINTGATDTYVYPNGYAFFGVSTSSSGGTSSPIHSDYYIYGDGKVTTSESTANSGEYENLTGTFYAIWRKRYLIGYNANEGKGGPGAQYMYAGLTTKLSSTKPTRDGYTFAGWSTSKTATSATWSAGATLSASYVNKNLTLYAVWTPNTYTITYNRNYSTTSTSTQSVTYDKTFTTKASSIFSRTGYTIANWSTSKTSVTGNYTKVSSSYTYTTAGNTTLYAIWELNTYTLTIRYYGGTTRQSNTTNLNITASNCTVSSSSIASGGSATVKHTYTGTSYSIVLKLSNSATYDYYMSVSYEPTINTYTKLFTTSSDSFRYSWSPTSNASVSIYVKQRYTISYNANGGSGTLPSTTYKIHGTSITLGTNSLTKTSYTANGWNTNTTGTGTHYSSGGSHSVNASDTLYADWTPKTSTIKVQIKTSTNGSSYSNSVTGGTVTVRYYYDNNNSPAQSSAVSVTSATATIVATNALISKAVTFTPTAKSGYVFVGISTSTSAPNSTVTTLTPLSSGATYTINVFFKVLSDNQLKYDSTDKYWYFEHGEYPQSYAAIEWDEYSGDGVYGGARITYNENTNVLTIDGTMTSGTGTILRTHGLSFVSGQVYTVWREYIGGNISIQNNTGTSLVIDTIVKNSDDGPSTRNNNDAGVDSRGSSNLTINSASQNEADGFKFWIWLNTGTTVTFDNYQIRIYVCYDNLLPNWSLSNVGTIPNPVDSNNNLTVYSVNNAIADMSVGTKFVQVNNRWFKVEPIRWRVSDYGVSSTTYPSGWGTYGTYKTNFTVVSDRILTLGAVVNDLNAVKEGWTFMKSGNLVSNYSSDYSVTGNNLTISYKASEQSYTLTNKSSSDPYATINQTISLTKGVKYRMYMDVTNTSGAVIGSNKVQVFYAINGSYNETNSRRFGDGTWKEFTVPATGIYNIRFDNDYGNTIIIKNFQVEVLSNNEASELSQNISEAYETFKSSFNNAVGTYVDMDMFGYAGQQEKVLTAKAYSEGVRVASIEEIDDYLTDYSAKASDMVCFLLGCGTDDKVNYWTRNLGTGLGNGQIITKAGVTKSTWLNSVQGVRLALTMGNGSRI